MVECEGIGGDVGGGGVLVSMCMFERVGRRGTVDGKADVGAVQPQVLFVCLFGSVLVPQC